MRRLHIVASSGLGALSNIAQTISALLIFSVSDFGSFAFLYAVYALGWSVCLSVICDTWLRTGPLRNTASTWRDYSSTLFGLSAIVMLVAVTVSFVVYPDVLSASLASAAIGLNVFRSGTRYFRASTKGAGSVLAADACNLAVFIGAFAGFEAIGANNLTAHAAAWLMAGIAAISIWPPSLSHPGRALIRWFRLHFRTIRTLLGDSLFMDFGAIGGPLLLLPLMGGSGFGTYRGISSVGSPVQLLLDPIRPNLAQLPAAVRTSAKLLVAVLGCAFVLASAGFAVLSAIGRYHLVQGTLNELSLFVVPCSVYVATNFLGHFYYILARANSSAKRIQAGRAVQTILAVACPLVGTVIFGLPGAVWGLVGATFISSTTWASLVITSEKTPNPATVLSPIP